LGHVAAISLPSSTHHDLTVVNPTPIISATTRCVNADGLSVPFPIALGRFCGGQPDLSYPMSFQQLASFTGFGLSVGKLYGWVGFDGPPFGYLAM
jgi:hypothetical protein